MDCQSYVTAREKGLVRLEGKDYVVQKIFSKYDFTVFKEIPRLFAISLFERPFEASMAMENSYGVSASVT